MAGVAEKARFYLERAVPQLREFEEKEIFSKDEVRSIVSKLTDHEHIVLSSSSTPALFLSYAAYLQTLEALRLKRVRRLAIRNCTSHKMHAMTLGVFERAVGKHPGSVLLWRKYLDYATSIKATKVWRKVMTRAVRMHPTEAGLWILAGRRRAADGDIHGARSAFMRGTRFCTAEDRVWVEFARMEMEWLARMEKKHGKGGAKELAALLPAQADAEAGLDEDGNMQFGEDSEEEDEFGEVDIIVSDAPRTQGGAGKKKGIDEAAIQKLQSSPAMEGAIPKAIFDIAQKQTFFDAASAERFFDVFALFSKVKAQPSLLQHVLDTMDTMFPLDPSTKNCHVKQPLVGIDPSTSAFPRALKVSLARLSAAMTDCNDGTAFAAKTVSWIEPILARQELDAGLRAVLEHTKGQMENR